MRVEQRSEIAVTEAAEELASVEGGCEESSVVGREGIEAGDAFVADNAATAQAVELYDCLVGRLNGGEGLEKAGVGTAARRHALQEPPLCRFRGQLHQTAQA